MRLFNAYLTVAIIVSLAGNCSSATIFQEDFESYTTTGEMNAVWSNGGTATLSSFGNPGNTLHHPGRAGSFSGGNTNTVPLSGVTVPSGGTLRFTAEIFDNGRIPNISLTNKRTTAGMRSGSSNIVEMGMYNDPAGYAFRAINFASGNPNWVLFSGIHNDAGIPISNSPINGWHRFSVEFSETVATFTLDLGSTGIINASQTVPLTLHPVGFSQIRLGGPSDVSSANGGVRFDNINLVSIPEPSTALLLTGIGLASLIPRRRLLG